jgi:hypothetical protein
MKVRDELPELGWKRRVSEYRKGEAVRKRQSKARVGMVEGLEAKGEKALTANPGMKTEDRKTQPVPRGAERAGGESHAVTPKREDGGHTASRWSCGGSESERRSSRAG